MKTCSVEGCDRPSFTKGLCNAHHARVLRHGDPGSAEIDTRVRAAGHGKNQRDGRFVIELDTAALAALKAAGKREMRPITQQAIIAIRRGLGLPDFEEDA